MSAKPHTTTKHAPKLVKHAPKSAPVDYEAVIKQMRSDIFMVAWRMKFTVEDAIVSQKSSHWEITTGHLEEMKRILDNTMDRYR